MKIYAGHYLDKKKNRLSASGGAATVLSETIIRMGGIVYGAIYETDYYSARFDYASNIADLEKFKGSKYSFVNKIVVRDGKKVGLFNDISEMLKSGKLVLLIGLGCDIGNMYKYLSAHGIDDRNLFTVELLCHGCTLSAVHREYILAMESKFKSKVVGFNLRYKEKNWEPTYIYIKFENGLEIKRKFDYSEYAYAFYNYKSMACYDCPYKGINNHRAHLAIGDYWGCCEGMESYDITGVSLILVQNEIGYRLINEINRDEYCLYNIEDRSFPLQNQPSYFAAHEKPDDWDLFNKSIRKKELMLFVHERWKKNMPNRFKDKKYNKIVIWGAGQAFLENFEEIKSICEIAYICDIDENKWGKKIKEIDIKSPHYLSTDKDVFVLVTASNSITKTSIVNELLDLGIVDFDFFENWITYSKA